MFSLSAVMLVHITFLLLYAWPVCAPVSRNNNESDWLSPRWQRCQVTPGAAWIFAAEPQKSASSRPIRKVAQDWLEWVMWCKHWTKCSPLPTLLQSGEGDDYIHLIFIPHINNGAGMTLRLGTSGLEACWNVKLVIVVCLVIVWTVI